MFFTWLMLNFNSLNCFQKFFRNICNGDGEFEGTLIHLPHEIYIAICDSLVEHFGNSEHNLETAVLALKVLCDIGRFSTFGNAAVGFWIKVTVARVSVEAVIIRNDF